MNKNFRESTHEPNHRLIHLIDSQTPTSLKTYTTSKSPEPTHYFWTPIMASSPVSSSTLSDSSDGINLISMNKRRKKANPLPAENKDEGYWERRKRNNESAKKSREVRRAKEQQTNQRVIFLEQENLKLKAEVDTLRGEIGQLREMLFNGRTNHRYKNTNK